ncbi:hypothetical protein MAR_015871, partial [Mya arenaria]
MRTKCQVMLKRVKRLMLIHRKTLMLMVKRKKAKQRTNYISTSTEKVLGPEDFVYGKEALEHYKLYTQIEAKEKRNRLQAEYERKIAEYDWKLAAIDEIIDLAKGFYVNPQSTKASKWRDLKRRVKLSSSHQIGRTEVRRKLGELPDYRPYFTYFIIL